jgi:hypothetical protein
VNFYHIHAVEEIFAEPIMGDLFGQIFVGGSNDADIGFLGVMTTDTGEGAVLEHAEKFDLNRSGHIADFIEKQGATVTLLK